MPELTFGKTENGKEITVDMDTFTTSRTCITGIAGSGKSHSVGYLLEQLCEKHYPFLVIDNKSEYWSLRTKYQILIIGGERGDVKLPELKPTHPLWRMLGNFCAKANTQIIFDISGIDIDEQPTVVYHILKGFYETKQYLMNVENKRTPSLIVIDDAEDFIPEKENLKSLKMVTRISLNGRKMGMGLCISGHRFGDLSKSVISQSDFYKLKKQTDDVDIERARKFITKSLMATSETLNKHLKELPYLKSNESIWVDTTNRFIGKITEPKKKTPDIGYTPRFNVEINIVDRKETLNSLVSELDNILSEFETEKEADIRSLMREIKMLREENMRLKKRLQDTQERVSMVAKVNPIVVKSKTERMLMEEPTENEKYFEMIEEFIMKNPECEIGEISDRLNIPLNPVQMCVKTLYREGRINLLRDPKTLRFIVIPKGVKYDKRVSV